jgi:hypothetical protein
MALKSIKFSPCDHCNQPKLPHRVCLNCGYYDKEEIVNVLSKELKKKEKEKKRRQK